MHNLFVKNLYLVKQLVFFHTSSYVIGRFFFSIQQVFFFSVEGLLSKKLVFFFPFSMSKKPFELFLFHQGPFSKPILSLCRNFCKPWIIRNVRNQFFLFRFKLFLKAYFSCWSFFSIQQIVNQHVVFV